jgi:hypothetical protein
MTRLDEYDSFSPIEFLGIRGTKSGLIKVERSQNAVSPVASQRLILRGGQRINLPVLIGLTKCFLACPMWPISIHDIEILGGTSNADKIRVQIMVDIVVVREVAGVADIPVHLQWILCNFGRQHHRAP